MTTKTCKLLVMIPGEPNKTVNIQWDPKRTFDDQLEPFLGKCYTEHVYISHENRRKDMFVDEMGRLAGKPRNSEAEKLYSGIICGPAVLFLDTIVWR